MMDLNALTKQFGEALLTGVTPCPHDSVSTETTQATTRRGSQEEQLITIRVTTCADCAEEWETE